MSLTVNFNASAALAHSYLAQNDTKLQNTIAQLSSGQKVNTAADNPSGLVASNEMQAAADSTGQAISNANDGVNMLKTAQGALAEISSLLDQIRSIAVHAANTGANNSDDTAADTAAIASAVASINNIATTTQFNGTNLLDGSYSAQLQIGSAATDTQAVSINAADATTLGVGSLDVTSAGNAATAITAIDGAISAVSTSEASLGSMQTYTLQSTINSLTVNQENTQASESTIKNADMSAEMTQFTEANVMEQAGVSMLAQANQQPNNILKLIQG